MSEDKKNNHILEALMKQDKISVPAVGDIVVGKVVSASKSEVRLDINGIFIGVVRGPELYFEAEEFANLKPGDEVEATIIDEENERGDLELSFKQAGQEKAWIKLEQALKDKEVVQVKVIDANKGGLLVKFYQIPGFLPVSQLSPENYPRVSGGDKQKILEKLKSFVGQEISVNVINLGEESDKIIFSEKDVWNKKQKHIIDKYKVGMIVDGKISAVTNFGVFISFGEGMEGLIHISELAWQRIDSPEKNYKVGDTIKAEIVNLDNNKIFLSAKRIVEDPWKKAVKKYKDGDVVKGQILKINPFGLFIQLDEEIHGLAHITQLGINPKEKISELFQIGQEFDFEILSISPNDHRLGLKLLKDAKKVKKDFKKDLKKEESELKIKNDDKEIEKNKEGKKDKKEDKKKVKKEDKKEKNIKE
ncbi:MAG: S1 RNA-binding domain-containing protein [Patescibacteria group bacterium]|nr:S1 RNA-binding domain-containing protein [Patescibacteria group bacterium]